MKVNGPSDIHANTVARRKKASPAGGSFQVENGGSAEETIQAAAPAGPVAALDSLLSLQEVAGRDEPLTRGRQTLDMLDDIRDGLLTGDLPVSKLKALAGLLSRERAAVSDPDLSGILEEIDLRAQVELAKYGIDIA